jgi:hypothetical protein
MGATPSTRGAADAKARRGSGTLKACHRLFQSIIPDFLAEEIKTAIQNK